MTFMRLKALKVEIEHLQLLMDKAKVKLQKEFQVWWTEEANNLQANSPTTNPQEHLKPLPQQDQPQLVSKKSYQGWEPEDVVDNLDVCIPERPMSSIPLTGDSQTDSDILAFIKARQSILQKKCKSTAPGTPPRPSCPYLFLCPTLGRRGRLEQAGSFKGKRHPMCSCSHSSGLSHLL
ncbi:Kinesin-like protein KIF6 [Cricetulus griseus]|uniref:Kinesin-like protein KIF6 n=1 Tax=Cricetulus griseus TaxID=10029 RepID=G3H9X9_CRIGR|nr:Kinesin-like protein KIF6 [Cricetulus griseus]